MADSARDDSSTAPTPTARAAGLDAAAAAVGRGEVVVLPTDTVYGVGADAFTPAAVTGLLAAKGRGRTCRVPVLVGRGVDHRRLVVSAAAGRRASWSRRSGPAALTLVVEHAPSLAWDLGDAEGTVAVRMPLHPVALDLLRATGPMAVSSANRSGQPAATTAQEARRPARGSHVAVVPRRRPGAGSAASTIVD